MQPKVFGYKGFVVKVTAHKLPSNVLNTIAQLKYVASIAIIRPEEGRLSDQIHWIHPKGIYATPEEIIEYGSQYATQVIDTELVEGSVDNSTFDNSEHIRSIVAGPSKPAE
jgi:hypothetical protein